MTKGELKDGMVVKTRCGHFYLVLGCAFINENSFNLMHDYTDELLVNRSITFYPGDNDYDIIATYNYKKEGNLKSLLSEKNLILVWRREDIYPTFKEALMKILPNVRLNHNSIPTKTSACPMAFGLNSVEGYPVLCDKNRCTVCWSQKCTDEDLGVLGLTIEDFQKGHEK